MAKKTALISGAGIAGPTLAYWIWRRGFEPVLIEWAPKFRAGGYVIDFWGVGFDVAERMELIPTLRELGYVNDRIAFVRQDGGLRSAFGGNALRRTLGDRFLSVSAVILLVRSTKRLSTTRRQCSATRLLGWHRTPPALRCVSDAVPLARSIS